MGHFELLKGKRILIVDDEPDILETLEDLLSDCEIDTAPNFETGKKFLNKNRYDLVILDIMGVRGYELLQIAHKKDIPALMLTAHALSSENLIKSIKKGAQAYVPKDKILDLPVLIKDVLEAHSKHHGKHGRWFSILKPFFDRQFGPGWNEKDREFWKGFENNSIASKKDLEEMM